uniref:Uncharacterized protein n=1 Tax=Musa acuminata subsp. malaccensis TaxID=214687 RepID=A0A804JL65_MUSAM
MVRVLFEKMNLVFFRDEDEQNDHYKLP